MGRRLAALVTILLHAAEGNLSHEDSYGSFYDVNCRCVFNCNYCQVPSILSTELTSSRDRVICREENGATGPSTQAWTTLTDPAEPGRSGHCRTSEGGVGEHMTIPTASIGQVGLRVERSV
jgi:hypothetical protein